MDGKSVPTNPIEPNYSKGTYISAYLSLFSGKRTNTTAHQFSLSREDYARGYCLYMFDVNSTYDSENNLPLLRKGHTRLQFKFDTALQEAVTCICYAYFPSVLKINVARNVEAK